MKRLGATCLLLVALGCEGEEGSFMTFHIHSLGFSPEGFDGLEMELRTSDGRVTLIGTDFTELSGLATSPAIPVPNSGQATIAIRFARTGETLVQGQVTILLREVTRWGVGLHRESTDPTEDCIGCEGVVAFPIEPEHQREPGDALWITWGGLREGEVAGVPFRPFEIAALTR
jgi:hypothetical protein